MTQHKPFTDWVRCEILMRSIECMTLEKLGSTVHHVQPLGTGCQIGNSSLGIPVAPCMAVGLSGGFVTGRCMNGISAIFG